MKKTLLMFTIIFILLTGFVVIAGEDDCEDCDPDEICIEKNNKMKCKKIKDTTDLSFNKVFKIYGKLTVDGVVIQDDNCCYLPSCSASKNNDIDNCDCVYDIEC
jgi:hypothetical protein